MLTPNRLAPYASAMVDDHAARVSAAGLAASPLHRFMGVEFRDPEPGKGYVEAFMPFSGNLLRQDGEEILHGGILASLVDVAGVWALSCDGGVPGPTVDQRVDFLRPALCVDHVARARVLRRGRTFAVTDVQVTDLEGRLVAVGRGLFAVGEEHRPAPPPQ